MSGWAGLWSRMQEEKRNRKMTDEQLRNIWKRHMGAIVCGSDELMVLRDVAKEATPIPDQEAVDWSVVREAVMDTADYNGIGGPKALQSSFKSNGLFVGHVENK